MGEIRVVETAAGGELKDKIERTRWEAGTWLPDGSEFLYIRFHVLADVDEANQPPVRVLQRLGLRRMNRGISGGSPLLYFETSRAEHLLKIHRAQAA